MNFDSQKYFNLVKKMVDGIDRPTYERVIGILLDCYYAGGVVYTMGCGGSASTATHFAADLSKTVGLGGFKAISLVDNIPLVSAWTNDFGWQDVFAGQLQSWITPKDVLVGFSVHGGNNKWSSNLTKAMEMANSVGAAVIGFAGFNGGAMTKHSDACFVVPTDSEVYGTPLVEAMHVVINHSIIWDLRERIQ